MLHARIPVISNVSVMSLYDGDAVLDLSGDLTSLVLANLYSVQKNIKVQPPSLFFHKSLTVVMMTIIKSMSDRKITK